MSIDTSEPQQCQPEDLRIFNFLRNKEMLKMDYEALAEKLALENEKLRREVEFLRGLMARYVEKHDQLAEGHA